MTPETAPEGPPSPAMAPAMEPAPASEELLAPEFLIYSVRTHHFLPREVFDAFGIVLEKLLDSIRLCAPGEYGRCIDMIVESYCRGYLPDRSDERHAITHALRELLENDAGRQALSNIDRAAVRRRSCDGADCGDAGCGADHDEGLFECLRAGEKARVRARDWVRHATRHACYLAKLLLAPADAQAAVEAHDECARRGEWPSEALYAILKTLLRHRPEARSLWEGYTA